MRKIVTNPMPGLIVLSLQETNTIFGGLSVPLSEFSAKSLKDVFNPLLKLTAPTIPKHMGF